MYRLYTEDINRPRIATILQHYFSGYTLIAAEGCYERHPESALIVELFTDDRAKVEWVAELICQTNAQESVAVVHLPFNASFVTRDKVRIRA